MLFHKSKGIIIVGCSPFGAALANTLYNKGHKVVVLDKDAPFKSSLTNICKPMQLP